MYVRSLTIKTTIGIICFHVSLTVSDNYSLLLFSEDFVTPLIISVWFLKPLMETTTSVVAQKSLALHFILMFSYLFFVLRIRSSPQFGSDLISGAANGR